MYYLQYLGSNLSPLNSQNVFCCSQCSPQPTGWDSWIQVLGLHKLNGTHQCTLIVLCNGQNSM